MPAAKTVDEFIERQDRFGAEVSRLREILLKTGLEECVKWGAPVYMHRGKNLVGIAAFKEHFGLWFFQGALLGDPEKVLSNAQEGKTQAMRQWRMEKKSDIKARTIAAYVKEAVAHQDAGKVIKPKRPVAKGEVVLPAELAAAFATRSKARKAYESLTPGKQREYANYIAEAKRDATKQSRIEKIIPMIESGIGLHDQYRNC
ncbi:MAG: YdeI family protein [Phycisphaerales bacterium JB050]